MAVFSKVLRAKDGGFVFRNAEPEDAAALIALVNRFDEETVFLSREPGEFDMTEERERAFVQQCKDSPACQFAVAEVDGVIAGTCTAIFGTRLRYRHVGEISISLLEAYWGRGMGQAMMRENIQWMRSCGVERVTLSVDTQNLRALALYQRLGFVVEGRLAHDRKLADGTYRDDYHMALDIKT